MMEDFKYKGFDVYYFPHPQLYGKWEIYEGEKFHNRTATKVDAKKFINQILREK